MSSTYAGSYSLNCVTYNITCRKVPPIWHSSRNEQLAEKRLIVSWKRYKIIDGRSTSVCHRVTWETKAVLLFRICDDIYSPPPPDSEGMTNILCLRRALFAEATRVRSPHGESCQSTAINRQRNIPNRKHRSFEMPVGFDRPWGPFRATAAYLTH